MRAALVVISLSQPGRHQFSKRQILYSGTRRVMDSTRFDQFGVEWRGEYA